MWTCSPTRARKGGLVLLLATVLLAAAPPRAMRVVVNELCASNAGLLLDPHAKQFSDWVELRNLGRSAVDLSGCGLSDDPARPTKWVIPAGTRLDPGACLLVWADELNLGLHANFKLSPKGGTIVLSTPAGLPLDRLDYPAQPVRHSFGRAPKGGLAFQASPTPGRPNAGVQSVDGRQAPAPGFSLPAGFHPEPIRLTLSGPPDAIVRYTLDGSFPTEAAAEAAAPLSLARTTVVRARCFPRKGLPSPCASSTYFIGERFTLPVASLALDPAQLWDEDSGMYALGRKASPKPPYYGANYREPWERPASVEFFERDGTRVVSQLAGLRIHGSVTRSVPQKSLALLAGDRYGAASLDHAFFPVQPGIRSYPRLLLRNSGNDWPRTLFRDGLSHSLVRGRMDLDIQEYRPAIVFLNGAYWGIQNLRERLDSRYVAAHQGRPMGRVDFLENFGKVAVLEGSDADFRDLLAFVEGHDLAEPAAYATVKARMDVAEFIDYLIVESFVGNVDWPVGNVKLWREDKPGSKWRWILYDTDLGFGLDPLYGADFDMIWLMLDPVGDPWPNPPWSTALIRALFRNGEFRRDFLSRYEHHLATTFAPARVLEVIDAMQAALAPEMPRQIARWKGQSDGFLGFTYPNSMEEWRAHVEALRAFAKARPDHVRRHLAKHFGAAAKP